MERRVFIKNTAASIALLSMGLPISCKNINSKKITILHTNDVHSHIEPFGPNEGKKSNKGGIARRASLIQNLRASNPNTLLFDAGDIFQGTPYFNYFEGQLEFKLMSMMKYDAATIGNHDFDNGITGLHKQMPHAKFDFISSNYDFKNTILSEVVQPYKIYFKDGIKIGVFGLGVQLDGLVSPEYYKETKYLNPVEITQDITNILKQEKKCDLIICLSHLGYEYENQNTISDISLAKKTKNIDLIIGGHTHTFLEKPTQVLNSAGEIVLVNQVGCHGIYLGKIDFYFENKHKFFSSELIGV